MPYPAGPANGRQRDDGPSLLIVLVLHTYWAGIRKPARNPTITVNLVQVQCCFTSTETIRTNRDGEMLTVFLRGIRKPA